MRRINYWISWILIISLPIMVIGISSILPFYIPTTYSYSFNDSRAVEKSGLSFSKEEVARATALYLIKPSAEKFQMVEKNGDYQDPVFDEGEQRIAQRIKIILAGGTGICLIFVVLFILSYLHLLRGNYKEALRNRFRFSSYITVICIIGRFIMLLTDSGRGRLFDLFIGTKIPKGYGEILYGEALIKAVNIFSVFWACLILGVLTVINIKQTKPDRIFY